MNHLGHTRSSYQRDHLLHTPDAFVRAALPGMRNAMAIIHAAPAIGAGFTEYTVEMESDASFHLSGEFQSFVYVLDGNIHCHRDSLTTHQYAWYPPRHPLQITSLQPARVVVIEKAHSSLNGSTPAHITGNAEAIPPEPMLGDEAVHVRHLLPDDFAFDCAINTMTFQPGATLPMVEIHLMEHGLLMLEGEGIYRLGEHWYPVKAGDFIWMAPFCPQWFGALGKTQTRYLIYKDWNRHPLK